MLDLGSCSNSRRCHQSSLRSLSQPARYLSGYLGKLCCSWSLWLLVMQPVGIAGGNLAAVDILAECRHLVRANQSLDGLVLWGVLPQCSSLCRFVSEFAGFLPPDTLA